MALPSALSYDVLPNSAQSRTFKTVISSRNSTQFNCNQKIEFALPQSEASYLDLSNVSMKFNIKAVAGTGNSNGAHLDFSVLSTISRVVCSCGGQVLSDISGYGALMTTLIQAGCSSESMQTSGVSCIGASGVPDLPLVGKNITLAGAYFVVPMTLGLFSSKKQLPLDTSSPVVITVYLASLDDAVFTPGNDNHKPGNLLFSEVEMHAYVVQLNSEAQLFLDQSLGEMSYNFNITDVANMQTSASAGSTSTVLPFRYSSLKSIMQICRVESISDSGEFSSGRCKNNIEEYYLDVGGDIIPSRHIKVGPGDVSEAMQENMVALYGNADLAHQGSLNHAHIATFATPTAGDNASPVFRVTEAFILDNSKLAAPHTYTLGTHSPGTFFAAISLESYKPAGDSDSLMCGLNTIGSQISWNNKGTGILAGTYDYYGFYDSVISLDPVSRILTANA